MGELWLEGSAGVLRLDGDARLWWKPHHGDEVAHRLRPGSRRHFRRRRLRVAAAPRRPALHRGYAAREHGERRTSTTCASRKRSIARISRAGAFRSPGSTRRPPESQPGASHARCSRHQGGNHHDNAECSSGASPPLPSPPRWASRARLPRRPSSSSATPTSPAARGKRPPSCSARKSSSTRRAATRCRCSRRASSRTTRRASSSCSSAASTSRCRATGTYATHIPTLNLTALPFIVETYPQGWKLYDESKWMQAQFAKGPEKGFRFLSTLRGRLPLDDDQATRWSRRPTPRARSCAASPTR